MDRETVERWQEWSIPSGVVRQLCDALLEAWDDCEEQARIVGRDIVIVERLESRVRVLEDALRDVLMAGRNDEGANDVAWGVKFAAALLVARSVLGES